MEVLVVVGCVVAYAAAQMLGHGVGAETVVGEAVE